MEKIDVFAHVLLSNYYSKMLNINSEIPKKFPFVNNKCLQDINERRNNWNGETKQIISYANVNPEDYCDSSKSAILCREANEELVQCIKDNQDMFPYGVGMIPLNNIEEALKIMNEIKENEYLVGIQLFTRHLGKSIADNEFRKIFEKASELDMPIWIHPVFDERKPDNNIVFSWEYELSQAMMQIVQANIFKDFPNIKIIIHHAGAMIPFFAGRVDNILPKEQAEEFKKFYVDTAILGNTKALELALSYFGEDKVLYGTDAPLGIMPAGATKEIEDAINELPVDKDVKEKIYNKNIMNLINKEK